MSIGRDLVTIRTTSELQLEELELLNELAEKMLILLTRLAEALAGDSDVEKIVAVPGEPTDR